MIGMLNHFRIVMAERIRRSTVLNHFRIWLRYRGNIISKAQELTPLSKSLFTVDPK